MANEPQPRKLINTHAHFSRGGDLAAQVKRWKADGAIRTCIACLDQEWPDNGMNFATNADLAPLLGKFADHVIGLAAVPPAGGSDVLALVDRWRDLGFAGLKMINPVEPYDAPRYHAIYARAEELGMPILFHTGLLGGHPGTLLHRRGHGEYMRPMTLEHIARRFPDLRIIGAHLGHPDQHAALKLLQTYPNVYFDFCGGSASRAWVSEMKLRMTPFAGADWDDPEENLALAWVAKMVFATDSATVATWHAAADDILDYLQIPAETRELFYWRNAAEIFGLDL